MSKKDNKISVNKFEALVSGDKYTKIPIDDNTTLEIKRRISLPDMLMFVQEVVDDCIDLATGDYTPEAYDFSIRVALFKYYTNITMPSNIKKQYDLVYAAEEIFNTVLENIDHLQFEDVLKAIGRRIEYSIKTVIASQTSEITKLIDKIESMTDASNQVFSSISASDIEQISKNLSKISNMSESDIVAALLDNTEDENELTISDNGDEITGE